MRVRAGLRVFLPRLYSYLFICRASEGPTMTLLSGKSPCPSTAFHPSFVTVRLNNICFVPWMRLLVARPDKRFPAYVHDISDINKELLLQRSWWEHGGDEPCVPCLLYTIARTNSLDEWISRKHLSHAFAMLRILTTVLRPMRLINSRARIHAMSLSISALIYLHRSVSRYMTLGLMSSSANLYIQIVRRLLEK